MWWTAHIPDRITGPPIGKLIGNSSLLLHSFNNEGIVSNVRKPGLPGGIQTLAVRKTGIDALLAENIPPLLPDGHMFGKIGSHERE